MRQLLRYGSVLIAAISIADQVQAVPTLDPAFSSDYSLVTLGSVAGLPPLYGGLVFKAGDPSTLIIGGAANGSSGRFYEIGVTRDASNHVTGFSGSASAIGGLGAFNDGGIVYGPGGDLFMARWPVNQLGEAKPGSTVEDKIIDLGPFGIGGSSISALNFVPTGFGGAGAFKIVTWNTGQWWDATLASDGSGTYDITGATQVDVDPTVLGTQNVAGGPEGFVYIASGNADFSVNSMLISEYSAGTVGAYELDAAGNPLVNTRRNFIAGLTGAEGATIDPLTGDFLFSTFGGGNQVIRVSGFQAPIPGPSVPEPGTLALLAIAFAGLSWARLRKLS